MARQNIGIGSAANDGTGDTLRTAGDKINDNFVELYLKLGGDSDALASQLEFGVGSVIFEGSTADSFETTLTVVDPTADRTVTIPDEGGTVVLDGASQTLTNKAIASPVLTTPQINDTSADHQYIFAVNELAADRTVTLPLLTGNDEFTFNAHTQTLTNKTLTSPAITTPDITTSINDTNGAELIKITATGSAVNEFTMANAATGSAPSISATGSDTNIDMSVSAKGNGNVVLSKLAYDTETITANGTADDDYSFHILNKATALAVTLADGTTTGEVQNFTNKGAGDATITPTNFAPGTSVTIQQNEAASFFWYGSNWFLIASYNGTLIP